MRGGVLRILRSALLSNDTTVSVFSADYSVSFTESVNATHLSP
jgi:hypothetical protein